MYNQEYDQTTAKEQLVKQEIIPGLKQSLSESYDNGKSHGRMEVIIEILRHYNERPEMNSAELINFIMNLK